MPEEVQPWCELVGIAIENLRGFRSARLSLRRPLTLLVGPNNSGKTSLLRLLHWALNDLDDGLLEGRRQLSTREQSLLVPARETRGAARRLTLLIQILDGRRARRFEADRGVVRLRLKVIGDRVFAATSRPRRSEPQRSEQPAIELLQALRQCNRMVYIPAARDAASERFRTTLGLAIRLKLEERGLHQRRGGAPSEYRTIRRALDTIDGVADELVGTLWSDLAPTLVPGLAEIGRISFDSSPQALVDWLVEQARLNISTGPHDERMVEPAEVGAGLQSLLDLALLEAVQGQGTEPWLLIEEPEAFLHPSAQRALASQLFQKRPVRRVISTHSPIVIDESQYGDVVLVRDHKVFEPAVPEQRREEINTALLTVSGAEAIYSRSVLLVEGPGDRAFFEALRRRLAVVDKSGLTGELGVVAVGGKTRFGPWIALLQSYADIYSGELPVRWFAVGDSADAASELARGVRDGGITVPAEVRNRLTETTQRFAEGDQPAAIAATEAANSAMAAAGVSAALLPIDLEYAALGAASTHTVRKIGEAIALDHLTRSELLRRLGSKAGVGPVSNPVKHEWTRGRIGQLVPWNQMSSAVKGVVRQWLLGVGPADRVDDLLTDIR